MSNQATLLEFFGAAASMKVDNEAGVIRGVKLLGPVSKNGRRYTEAAIKSALSLYEGAKVNVNHPDGALDKPRTYHDRIGVIRSPRKEADGVFGDFHFNPKHALAEQLAWDAEHAPENVGFSHNVVAKTNKGSDGIVEVQQVLKVLSVDLVADPATTRGLFEHEEHKMAITLEAVKESREVYEALRAEIIAEQKNGDAAKERDAEFTKLKEDLTETKKKLDEATLRETISAKKALAAKLIGESKLPAHAVTDFFREQVEQAADEATAKKLIDDRRTAVGDKRPQSKSQHVSEGTDFASVKSWDDLCAVASR